jgi:hypothetical protein
VHKQHAQLFIFPKPEFTKIVWRFPPRKIGWSRLVAFGGSWTRLLVPQTFCWKWSGFQMFSAGPGPTAKAGRFADYARSRRGEHQRNAGHWSRRGLEVGQLVAGTI